MSKKLLCYLFIIHSLLLIVLVKSDFLERVANRLGFHPVGNEITDYYHTMVAFHSRMDANNPSGSVFFIGDSITQGLSVTAVTPSAINYGIGADTSKGILLRLPLYRSLLSAEVVIIAIGINDMRFRTHVELIENIKKISTAIRADIPIVFSAVLPLDQNQVDVSLFSTNNRDIRNYNDLLYKYTLSSDRFHYVDAGAALSDTSGNLNFEFHVGDGIHLNSDGYSIWIKYLREMLEIIRQRPVAG